MICMNCGQQLPDGAKFCLNCGTPQGTVSPTGTTQSETINLDEMHTFVPAMCPNCSAHMKVDPSSKIAQCEACGTECLVQDAIKALTVRGNVQVGSATINVSGTNTDSLLQRVEIMLGDGDFGGAMSKCDTILDSDPTNGRVYFYMLMSDLKCRNRTSLANQSSPFDGNQYYVKAVQYGDASLKSELAGYTNEINARNEAKLKNPQVGDVFFLGLNNEQRIFWKVLRIQDRMALVITTSDVSDKWHRTPYHETDLPTAITWSDCTLRKWLNNDFVSGYFTPAEQARILPCKLNNDNNPTYGTSGGVPTTDKVFLLSLYEVEFLFANDQARTFECDWWLRSPGKEPRRAAYVSKFGMVISAGHYANSCFDSYGGTFGVRPTMWINLDANTRIENDSIKYSALIQEEKRQFNARLQAERKRQEEESERKRQEEEAKQKNPKIGDEIFFGTCYKNERRRWKVLDIRGRNALIICSENVTTPEYYHQPGGIITWSDCNLRKWLNNTFLSNCFSQTERAKILSSQLANHRNPKYMTRGGKSTTDMIFLLSIQEAHSLFPNDQARANGSCWWLRSPGDRPTSAAYVRSDGKIIESGDLVNSTYYQVGVRPAMWITLD